MCPQRNGFGIYVLGVVMEMSWFGLETNPKIENSISIGRYGFAIFDFRNCVKLISFGLV